MDNRVSKYNSGEITRLVMYTQIALIPKGIDEAQYVVKILPERIKKNFNDWINEFDADDPEKQSGNVFPTGGGMNDISKKILPNKR